MIIPPIDHAQLVLIHVVATDGIGLNKIQFPAVWRVTIVTESWDCTGKGILSEIVLTHTLIRHHQTALFAGQQVQLTTPAIHA